LTKLSESLKYTDCADRCVSEKKFRKIGKKLGGKKETIKSKRKVSARLAWVITVF